ncbi:MAG TPA: class I SAM-dependent methyltransferase [Pseudonocardiaceae bacterium]|nr:class I SAM-dependent methyltransferase [Pseudonocardiaceae bacterium]
MSEPDFLRRTRTSYDTLADYYAVWIQGELATKPLDRALLAGFAELVLAAGGGPVADIGCGEGRVAAHLHSLGLSAFGIDLSPKMLANARRTYPDLRFDEGSMTALDVEDGTLGGIVAWYSIIHVPSEHVPAVLTEFRRVLAPGGYLQLAFQAGDELAHRTELAGLPVELDFQRLWPSHVAELLRATGFVVCAETLRAAETDSDFPENTPQGFVLARKPG